MTTPDLVPDHRQLHTFLTVIEQGGVSAAARQLGISQPSVSQQMRRLEDRLGHPLFDRDAGGLALTTDGEALVVFARAMLSVADQVRAYFGRGDAAGVLRVGFNEDFARTALPAVLGLFTRSHPALELLIDCHLSSAHLFAELDAGRLDLVAAKVKRSQVRGETLWTERLRWIGRRHDMRFANGPVPLVCGSTSNPSRDMVFEALAGAGLTWRTRFQSPSLSALEAAVCSGLGVGALMKGMATGGTQVLDDDCGLPPLPELTLCLDMREGTHDPAVIAFAALLRETMMQIEPRDRTEHTGDAALKDGML